MNEKPQLVVVGGGMITRIQLLPTIYHLQREGVIGDIHVCALNSPQRPGGTKRAKNAAAQELAASQPENGLPANRLRFTLEYTEIPDPEAERQKIATLLGGNNFSLEPLDPLLPQFLVLQFSGIERRMSPASQFAAADALVDALGQS